MQEVSLDSGSHNGECSVANHTSDHSAGDCLCVCVSLRHTLVTAHIPTSGIMGQQLLCFVCFVAAHTHKLELTGFQSPVSERVMPQRQM